MPRFYDIIHRAVEKKFFYDNFTESDVCGMFTAGHFISVILFFSIAAALLHFSRRLDEKGTRRVRLAVAILVTLMEIVKISLRIYKDQWYDSWVPLYYCSLFIFAIWLSFVPCRFLSRTGYAFITMGGILVSVFFTFYPSTSLAIFPIWHPAAIHSFVYHLIMFYTGVLVLMKREFVPEAKDSVGYFVFIFLACLPSLLLNLRLGTNCMFLNHAFKLPILEPIINYSKPLYIAVVFIAQGVLMFWFNYMLYRRLPHVAERIVARHETRRTRRARR